MARFIGRLYLKTQVQIKQTLLKNKLHFRSNCISKGVGELLHQDIKIKLSAHGRCENLKTKQCNILFALMKTIKMFSPLL